MGDRTVGILHVIVRRQINIILSRESKCRFRIQKEEIDHLATDKNQPLISVVDLSGAIKKTERCKWRCFSPGSPVFPQPQKRHSNFQLSGPEPDRRRTTSWIWNPSSPICFTFLFLFIHLLLSLFFFYFFTHDLALAPHNTRLHVFHNF